MSWKDDIGTKKLLLMMIPYVELDQALGLERHQDELFGGRLI